MWLLRLTLASLALGSQDNPDGVFFPAILVRARVTEVVKGKEEYRVTFFIQHVYAGGPKLKGQRFELRFTARLFRRTARIEPALGPPFTKGEVDIWALARDPTTGRLVADIRLAEWRGRTIPPPLPGRKDVIDVEPHSPYVSTTLIPYDQALRWAEMVEKAYRATGKARTDLLKKMVLNPDSRSAAWAVYLLEQIQPPDLSVFLRPLVTTKRLSAGAQVALDQVLSHAEESKWYTSAQRLKLLTAWVSGQATPEYVLGHLKKVARREELDYATLLGLVKKGLANKKRSSSFRRYLHQIAEELATRSTANKKRAFDFWVAQVQRPGDEELRVWAACSLAGLIPLSGAQRAAVRALEQQTKDREVAAILGAAVLKCDTQLKNAHLNERLLKWLVSAIQGGNGPRPHGALALFARRLGLTREQTMAVQSLLKTTLDAAQGAAGQQALRMEGFRARFKRQGPLFECLIIAVRLGKTFGDRWLAASSLLECVPLERDQTEAVRALLKVIKEPAVRDELAAVLQKSQKSLKE